MKKLIKSFFLVGLGAVILMAGFASKDSLPVVELVSPSYAGSFERGDAGPVWVKCKDKCSGDYLSSYCISGCDYYYNVVSNWIGSFEKGDAGPAWVKCKDKCTAGWSASGKHLLCNTGCDYSYEIISKW